jgi:hypothetical protein
MATELEVDVARVGYFRGMGNNFVDLTQRVLQDLAASLNLAAFRPKVWAGHTAELRTDSPALGDVVGLRVLGDRLMAKLRLTAEGARRMADGGYTERSIEMDFQDGRARFRGLALLGARAPAISGLSPLFLTGPAGEKPGMILLAAAGDDGRDEDPEFSPDFGPDGRGLEAWRAATKFARANGVSFAEAARHLAEAGDEAVTRYLFSG